MVEFAIHRSAYQLKEADPHTFAIPRLGGPGRSAMIEIQADEYGGGRPGEAHAELFAAAMTDLGLDATFGHYVDRLPGSTLATDNLVSLFALQRRLRGALIGHLALFEMCSVTPMSRYLAAARRIGEAPNLERVLRGARRGGRAPRPTRPARDGRPASWRTNPPWPTRSCSAARRSAGWRPASPARSWTPGAPARSSLRQSSNPRSRSAGRERPTGPQGSLPLPSADSGPSPDQGRRWASGHPSGGGGRSVAGHVADMRQHEGNEGSGRLGTPVLDPPPHEGNEGSGRLGTPVLDRTPRGS